MNIRLTRDGMSNFVENKEINWNNLGKLLSNWDWLMSPRQNTVAEPALHHEACVWYHAFWWLYSLHPLLLVTSFRECISSYLRWFRDLRLDTAGSLFPFLPTFDGWELGKVWACRHTAKPDGTRVRVTIRAARFLSFYQLLVICWDLQVDGWYYPPHLSFQSGYARSDSCDALVSAVCSSQGLPRWVSPYFLEASDFNQTLTKIYQEYVSFLYMFLSRVQ